MTGLTKLLVVDDSALMRRCLRTMFEADGRFSVFTARNGLDALAQIAAHDPDVVTLDVNMPEMDGLTCLSEIMARAPRPVVMLSSITAQGAQATLEALELGAVDFLEKPGGTVSLNIDRVTAPLVAKVSAAASAKPRRARGLVERLRQKRAPPRPTRHRAEADGLVLIGVSTGGPRTLEDILPELPADFPWPIIVAQHMPGAFTASFASRLDGLCALTVVEAHGPMPIRPGHVYVARGGADIVVATRLGRRVVEPMPEKRDYAWHPSIDRLVRSALEVVVPDRLIAVQLTGMGDDGAEAMADLRRRGGRTIAEHESTAIVYGMPAELVRLGGAELVLPSHEIAGQLSTWIN